MIVTQDDVLEVLRIIQKGTVFEILYQIYEENFSSNSSEYVNISQKLTKLSNKKLLIIDRSKKIFIYSII